MESSRSLESSQPEAPFTISLLGSRLPSASRELLTALAKSIYNNPLSDLLTSLSFLSSSYLPCWDPGDQEDLRSVGTSCIAHRGDGLT